MVALILSFALPAFFGTVVTLGAAELVKELPEAGKKARKKARKRRRRRARR